MGWRSRSKETGANGEAHHWSRGELIENYIDECIDRNLSEATVRGYRTTHKNYLTEWDERPVNSIKRSDERDLFGHVSKRMEKASRNRPCV